MTTFTHKFFGWLEAQARRHINPDGSEGAIVAVTATIASGLRLTASVEVGPWASIGPRASIGYGASIGPRASIGYGEWWITVGPQGSRNAILTAVQKPEGLRWWVGCQEGITTEALLARVQKAHGDTPHGDDYRAVIAFVEAHPGRLRLIKEDTP